MRSNESTRSNKSTRSPNSRRDPTQGDNQLVSNGMGGLGVVTFYSEIPDFEGAPGPTIPPKNTPREYVEEFLDENLLQLIVIETN